MSLKVKRIHACAALILVFCGIGFAETHYTFTSNTGNNMTVLVKAAINPTVEGSAVSNGDEIGVFSPSGLCAGAAVWNGVNTVIIVWGDNDQTSAVDGMSAGDQLTFKIWDKSASKEVQAVVTYESGGPKYSADGIAILSSLASESTSLIAHETNRPGYNTIIHGNLLSYLITKEAKTSIAIFTIGGKKLIERTDAVQAGKHILDLGKLSLSRGSYLLCFSAGNIQYYRIISIMQ